MRLRRLELSNVKLLAEQELSFLDEHGEPRRWTALVGENGVCKTSILQAIAIASSGDKMARALVEDAADFVHAGRPEATAIVRASFERGAGSELHVAMQVEPGKHAFAGSDGANELNAIRDSRAPGHLVVGYGVGRRLPRKGEVSVPRDPVANRVEGLFDTHHKMLGLDFFDALRDEDEHLGLEYARVLREVLLTQDVEGNKLLPWLTHVELRGQGGVQEMHQLLESRRLRLDVGGPEPLRLSSHQLSQGYQSTFAWIADLLGHAFLDARGPVKPEDLRGIVLLDEIDLHLHPTWQRRIVPILRRAFPELQFVVTTHSPLVLTGFDASEIVKLELEDGEIVQRTFELEPGLQTGTDLIGAFFDVPTAARPDLAVKEERLVELLAKSQGSVVRRSPPLASAALGAAGNGSLSSPEQAELEALRTELKPYLRSSRPLFAAATTDLRDPEAWRSAMREVSDLDSESR